MSTLKIDNIELHDSEFDMVARSIIDGSWENHSRELWKTAVCDLPRGAVVWDVGAYTGYYSLVAARLRPDITVVAFEPHPIVFKNLLKNVDANNLENISCVQVALGSSNKSGVLNVTNNIKFPSGSSICLLNKNICDTIGIIISSGNEFYSTPNSMPSLVKIDVEGAETEVLIGLREVLQQVRPIILIELLTEDCRHRAEIVLQDVNYTMSRINEATGTFAPPFSDRTDRNYWCTPNTASTNALGLVEKSLSH